MQPQIVEKEIDSQPDPKNHQHIAKTAVALTVVLALVLQVITQEISLGITQWLAEELAVSSLLVQQYSIATLRKILFFGIDLFLAI
ncbi:MAG: hypothetical protein KME49_21610 [Brasilonema octagenarum HA4186-MV1]|jgi:hypothetical protein|uniref:Uncharacterized protein n=1 Tax=Brasilonema octagenarum UFV-OR1 TaxID=417115 RepID=A0ABX1M268_9CYAN|nr:hypothetical protein [Brasilonema octagenarum]MBW4628033.1 hypothetical protein [Brasilonema octagenarum HA4186-MV1]NMF61271.1 hypothetical protein [Brasilonema octagenarum UFV-OR1]